MGNGKIFILIAAVMIAVIFCGVGFLFRKKDIFSALDHPWVKRYPNISRIFGTVMIGFALIWLCIIAFCAGFL